MLDRILQFPHVARPAIIHEHSCHFWIKRTCRGTAVLIKSFQEVLDELGKISLVLAKWWNFEVDDVQAVKEIFAEGSLRDHLSERAIGC